MTTQGELDDHSWPAWPPPGRQPWQTWEDAGEIWEHQGRPLTAGDLHHIVSRLPPSLPVLFEVYVGDHSERVIAVDIGYAGGHETEPTAISVTLT
jgi:hypothetical protein